MRQERKQDLFFSGQAKFRRERVQIRLGHAGRQQALQPLGRVRQRRAHRQSRQDHGKRRGCRRASVHCLLELVAQLLAQPRQFLIGQMQRGWIAGSFRHRTRYRSCRLHTIAWHKPEPGLCRIQSELRSFF